MTGFLRRFVGIIGIYGIAVLNGFATDYPPEDYLTHTIPIIYIDTEGGVPITSKEEYLNATCYIDAEGLEGYESLGSEDAPLTLQIKGRGNSSWSKPKKPYRLKFDSKVSPLGMKKNRHFVLLAEWIDGNGRINWETGFFVSQLMGLPWTPAHEPVELVLNGEYVGLYFLSEKIKLGSGRVNIDEQDDGETNPDLVTGGWLCEIDNYSDSPQVTIRDRSTGKWLRTTIHSPEELSSVQTEYITNLVKRIDDAIYCKDKTSTIWEQLIDLDALVRYYLVCEIVNQVEGFSGSCYWWKERGDDTKINFGPVWDFDTSNANWKSNKFFYENNEGDPIPDRNHWIMEIAKYPRFQQYVRELWAEYCDSAAALVEPHALAFVQRVHAAAESDILRWYSYFSGLRNTNKRARKYLDRLNVRHEWLSEQWSRPVAVIGDVNVDGEVTPTDVDELRQYLLDCPIDTISIENANTYCDDTIDVCDLVGAVRLVYKQDHPDESLPTAPSIPYGVNDHAVSTVSFMTVANYTGDIWRPDQELDLGLCVSTASDYSAFSVEISTPPSISIADMRVKGIDDEGYHLYKEVIDSTTTRIIGYSSLLRKFDEAETGTPFLILALRTDSDTLPAPCYVSVRNLLLVDTDMSPTRIEDVLIPINVFQEGDVDCNGVVDISDVNAVINIILNINNVNDFPGSADINGDGNIDICDLVGVVRLVYKQDHPDESLPVPPTPNGVDDYAVSTVSFLNVANYTGDIWYPDQELDLGLCVSTESGYSAFSVEISTLPSISIADMRVKGIDDEGYHLYKEVIDSTTTRIIGYSSLLRKFDEAETGTPFLILALRAESDTLPVPCYVKVSNLLLVDTDMSPTRIEDVLIPINVFLEGDVDCNGVVDISDVNAIINIILRINNANDYPGSADMNGDGSIDISDVNEIVNIILTEN